MNAHKFEDIGPSQAQLLEQLFRRAAENLSDGDLDRISSRREDATQLAGYLATVTEDIGCIVSDEAAGGGQWMNGDRLSNLMFMLSNVASQAEGLLVVSTAARDLRAQRQGSNEGAADGRRGPGRKGATGASNG